MRRIDKSILLCALVCGFELTASGNDFKPLNEYSANCEKLTAESFDHLKSLSLAEFRNQIGYSDEQTVIRRKDFDKPKDIDNYDYQQTNNLYKKYCESQGGSLYGNEEGYYHPIGHPWPHSRSYSSEFGNEAVCIKEQSAIFVKNFKIFYEKCSFFCDYPSTKRNVEHAEILLTSQSEILDAYTNKFKEFLQSNPNYASELKEARVGHMTCNGETTLEGIGIKLSSDHDTSLKIYNRTSNSIEISSIVISYDLVQSGTPFKSTMKMDHMDAFVNQNASLSLSGKANNGVNKFLRDAFKDTLPSIKPIVFHIEITYSTPTINAPIMKTLTLNVIPKENDSFFQWWAE